MPVDGLATDFFMVDRPWASSSGFFPLRFGEFLDKYADLLNYAQEMPFVERFFAGRFLAAVRSAMEQAPGGKDPWGSAGPRRARELLRLIGERAIDPTGSSAPEHKGHWPDIGLVTSEVAAVKREIVFANAELHGPVLDRLRAGDDLSWYNRLGD